MFDSASFSKRFSSSATSLRLAFNALVFSSVATSAVGSGALVVGVLLQDDSAKRHPQLRNNFNFIGL
jgi:hypothetical protein